MYFYLSIICTVCPRCQSIAAHHRVTAFVGTRLKVAAISSSAPTFSHPENPEIYVFCIFKRTSPSLDGGPTWPPGRCYFPHVFSTIPDNTRTHRLIFTKHERGLQSRGNKSSVAFMQIILPSRPTLWPVTIFIWLLEDSKMEFQHCSILSLKIQLYMARSRYRTKWDQVNILIRNLPSPTICDPETAHAMSSGIAFASHVTSLWKTVAR